VLKSKILYGTRTLMKKPRYSDGQDSQNFDNKVGNRFEPYEEIEQLNKLEHLVTTLLDITTVAEILKEGDF
jgi:hypothetical protein